MIEELLIVSVCFNFILLIIVCVCNSSDSEYRIENYKLQLQNQYLIEQKNNIDDVLMSLKDGEVDFTKDGYLVIYKPNVDFDYQKFFEENKRWSCEDD